MGKMLSREVVQLASRYFEGLDTPISLGLHLRVKYGEWDQISEVTPDPRNYLDHDSYCRDALAAGLLRKYEDLPSTHDKVRNAVAKWWDGERTCYETNLRMRSLISRNLETGLPQEERVRDFVSRVRQIIRGWIGAGPPQLLSGRFGPGATFVDKGIRTTVPDKMTSEPVLTPNAKYYLLEWKGTAWADATSAVGMTASFVRGNRFSTVPKTSKTDRSIAVEPSINVFYQLALGQALKDRLARRAQWDMSRVQELHGWIAASSSRTREYDTLDLSNASDTVSYDLVRLLLPHRWFSALDDLRSPYTLTSYGPDGTKLAEPRWVKLEKFSSMGNGFTFELETVIFAAISCAVSREAGYKGLLGKDVYTFGDDIIVKHGVGVALKSVLAFFGFAVNAEKSYFMDEPFRESCGSDYFDGRSCRPYFLKDEPNEPQDYIKIANGIRRAALQLHPSMDETGLLPAWFVALDCLPTHIRRCRGPEGLGDIVIHDMEAVWSQRRRRDVRYLQVYRPHRHRKVSFGIFKPEVVLACATYGTGNTGTPVRGRVPRVEGVIPRDSVTSYKVGWVAWG